MSDILANRQPDDLLPPGHYGRAGQSGVAAKIVECGLATLIAGRGSVEALSSAFIAETGHGLPQGPAAIASGGLTVIGTGPGRWMVASDDLAGEALLERLETIISAHGSVTDQSDASVVCELTGPKLRDALMKMVLIDIDPKVFKPGSAVTTQIALISATLWQIDHAPTFRCLVARSYREAFIRALSVSAAEFGFDLS